MKQHYEKFRRSIDRLELLFERTRFMKKTKNGKQEIVVSGVINSLEWDDDDNITAVELSTDEMDYIVESNRLGKELFDCIGEEVEVVGIVTKGDGSNDHIKITSYEVIDFYDEDEEEDDDYYYDDDEEFDDDEDYDFDDDDDDYR